MDNKPVELTDEEMRTIHFLEKSMEFGNDILTQSFTSQHCRLTIKYEMCSKMYTMIIYSPDNISFEEESGEIIGNFGPRTIERLEERFKGTFSENASFENCKEIAEARFMLEKELDKLQFNNSPYSIKDEDRKKVLRQFDNDAERFINYTDHHLFISHFKDICREPKSYIEKIIGIPHKNQTANATSNRTEDEVYANIEIEDSKLFLGNEFRLIEPISIKVTCGEQNTDCTTSVQSRCKYNFFITNKNTNEKKYHTINVGDTINVYSKCLDKTPKQPHKPVNTNTNIKIQISQNNRFTSDNDK